MLVALCVFCVIYFRKEIKKVLQASYLRAFNVSFYFASTSLIAFITFMVYSLAGNALLPAKVYLAIPLYNVLRLPLLLFVPFAVMNGMEARISVKRIQVSVSMVYSLAGNALLPAKVYLAYSFVQCGTVTIATFCTICSNEWDGSKNLCKENTSKYSLWCIPWLFLWPFLCTM